tara:strand:- start:1639 stop:2082 length:444 start_codon:yes stop_codon:yes gene_type:complete
MKQSDINKPILTLDISCIISFLLILYNINQFSNINDKFIIVLSLIFLSIYFIGRTYSITNLFPIFHVLWGITMIIIPLSTNNRLLLFYHLCIILFTLSTRRIFKGCIIRNLETKKESISNNSFTKKIKWDLLFPVLGFISAYKLYIK